MTASSHGGSRTARRSLGLGSFCLVLLLSATLAETGLAAEPAEPAQPGYIVGVRPSPASLDAEVAKLERATGAEADLRYRHALEGFSAELSPDQVRELRRDPQVAFVTRDRVLTAAAAQPIVAGDVAPPGVVRMGAASGQAASAASTVGVAVLDTGIDLTHPDLVAQNGINCVGPGSAQDDNGHGTHVAGTIAAENNGTGVVGVAPGTRLYAVKVLDANGDGLMSSIICGIDWVTRSAPALNIRVANLSLGGPAAPSTCASDALHQAICHSTQAGVTYTVAAGNDGADFGGSPQNAPAAYPEVLAVTAASDTDGRAGGLGAAPACQPGEADDVYASFSDFARTPADAAHTIAAPGTCIRSTWLGGGYRVLSGTSMAAPHVAGAVALCLGEVAGAAPCAGLTPAETIQQVRNDAAAHGTPTNGFLGDPLRPLNVYFGDLAWAGARPATATGSASAVSATGATVSGAVGGAASYRFEYGTSRDYGSATVEQLVPAAASVDTVRHALTDLAPGTTYHYRIVTQGSDGRLTGIDRTLLTAGSKGVPAPEEPRTIPRTAPEPVPVTPPQPAPPAAQQQPPQPTPEPTPRAPAAPRASPSAADGRGLGRMIVARVPLRKALRNGLAIRFSSDEPGLVSAEAALRRPRLPGLAVSSVVGQGRARAGAPAANGRVMVRFGRTARQRLGRRRAVTLTLRLRLLDRTGHVTTLRRSVSLTR